MLRRVPVPIVVVWLVSARVLLAQTAPFLAQRDAEFRAGDTGRFSIAFADERRTFHPGEAIPLTFTFTRYDISP